MTQTRSMKMTLTAEGGLPGAWEFGSPSAVVIGRGENASVKPMPGEAARSLSRYHAVIELSREGAVIRDLGSLNGTWLNGHLVGKREGTYRPNGGTPVSGPGVTLANGDIITLGRFTLRINLIESSEAEPVADQPGEAKCPGCGRPRAINDSARPDELCQYCRSNPVAALKMLRAGLSRGVKSLSALKGLRIEKTLGRGATSAVFLAVRKDNGAKLALKVMPPAVSDNEWAKKSFLREASLGKALRHPNVARLYEFGSYSGAYFVLMEYCEGGSAEEIRGKKDGGRMSIEEALKIVIPMLDGLHYMHTVPLATADSSGEKDVIGLVHRDLKPANVFLGGADGRTPKIADIGVAKFHGKGGSCHTRTGAMAGSPATMPRQQAMNFKYAGPEVDVWAAAATLYKLVTGQYPREFPADRDPWRVVMSEAPRPVRNFLPNFPEHLSVALDEALIDDPAIFHKTALSLKESLLKAAKRDGLDTSAY
ncbi:hypothetical protein C4J81_00140 [Deltaproteobacteria bacterium Smac51]|nr:hypothetical protein C4J81_00140 [Deltaproteobacteria bacterium Smac51]